jgi:hypothetical protein
MHLGQNVSIHSLSAHGKKVIFCEETQSRNCASRYVHEPKIIYKTIVLSCFSSPAHISLFLSEQNLHHGSFSKISFKTLNHPLFMWMDRGDFMSPRKIWWEDNFLGRPKILFFETKFSFQKSGMIPKGVFGTKFALKKSKCTVQIKCSPFLHCSP